MPATALLLSEPFYVLGTLVIGALSDALTTLFIVSARRLERDWHRAEI